jgi:D-tyrosyl-tRNA(Tyr) deacylase
MRIVLQRVSSASVTVDGARVGRIGGGLCLLVGVAPDDDERDVEAAVDKIVGLRVFGDADGKMNLSLLDTGGEVLVVSQFTLLGDVRKGRRPSFTNAAPSEHAGPLIDLMVERMTHRGIVTVNGVFGAFMEVELTNDGPVTLVLEVTDGIVR